ncbi:MAG: hypothetical protein HOO04_05305 [Phycisphaerae bacterium]|jgi:hypothetical protein|nr:hypothetical protein [Phycisphaerae bacterium]MBT5582892.1 hypothetical protein [Phycisphaerae bacterium]MBT7352358.1 hypothetical protein [Phycisphaerae bacterium]
MTQATEGSARYRIRHDGQTSPWMTADQLKQATMLGQVPHEALVQPAGRNEWIQAGTIKGLEFPEAAEPKAAPDPIDHHPRFKTLRDLLANFLHCSVSINLRQADHFDEAELLLCCEDHFEINLPRLKTRVFVPYARIKAIASVELEEQGSQYRDSHKVRIEVDPCQAFTATGD